MSDAPTPKRSRAGAIALICIGLLILVPSGLCTVIVGGMSVYDQSLLALALVYGTLPILVGAGLLIWGVARYRRR